MEKTDIPVVTGFKRLSWLLGIIAAAACFLSTVPYYYIGEVAAWTLVSGGAAFGFARILVLVIRGFRVGNEREAKVITGFKRFSWLATLFFSAMVGIVVGYFEAVEAGFFAGIVSVLFIFPLFRVLIFWIVKGFAGSVINK